jgi:NAD(P)-dependent dehydrogenase (short-subunit alcohol dehydrogenase family)
VPLEISYRVGSKRSLAAFSTISRRGQYVHSASMFAHIRADTLEESWPGIIEATERRFGRLDVMMANAGIGILCKAVEMSLADWRRQTAVNLDGVFLSVTARSRSCGTGNGRSAA